MAYKSVRGNSTSFNSDIDIKSALISPCDYKAKKREIIEDEDKDIEIDEDGFRYKVYDDNSNDIFIF